MGSLVSIMHAQYVLPLKTYHFFQTCREISLKHDEAVIAAKCMSKQVNGKFYNVISIFIMH